MAHVLVVDDDDMVRNMQVLLLQVAKHEVTACEDYDTARDVLRASVQPGGKKIDLIVTDGEYPGDTRFRGTPHGGDSTNGSACLMQEVSALQIKAPVIMVTGNKGFFDDNPFPPECRQPDRIFQKASEEQRMLPRRINELIANPQLRL